MRRPTLRLKMILGIILSGALFWVLFLLFRKPLVEDLYFNRSLPFLNSIISGREIHSLDFYQQAAVVIAARTTFLVMLIATVLVCLFTLPKKQFFFFIWIFFATTALFEGFTIITFKHPQLLSYYPQNLQNILRHIFLLRRHAVQFDSRCAQYDSELTYTLKPGQCIQSDYEFSAHYQINSSGVRDDESSLKSPEIIVLGDSYAMGWGVEQDVVFSQILEKKSGKCVLNAGITSYGTVREMKLLNRLDTSKLKLLIIQYHENDARENAFFRSHNKRLYISSKFHYNYARIFNTKYFFGKHTYILLSEAWKNSGSLLPFQAANFYSSVHQRAYDFLYALKYAPSLDLSSTKILVLGFDEEFSDEASRLAKQSEIFDLKDISFIDLGLQPDCYYPLDSHMNPKGHALLADRILKWMKENGATEHAAV